MSVATLAGLLAGLATLLQLAALAAVLTLARRLRSPTLVLAVAALGLMAVRRAVSACAAGGLPAASALGLVQETSGLVISALALGLALVMGRTLRTTAEAPAVACPDPSGGAEAAAAREEERQLLCYDLHDGVAQLVVGAGMHLDTFCALREEDPARADRELSLASLRIKEAITELTRVISFLAPVACEDTPLGTAVKSHLARLAEEQEWEVELEDDLGERRFPPRVEGMTFRAVQEALNNAARHSRTQRVQVSLHYSDGALVATVRDWGRGFDPGQPTSSRRHLGLQAMHSRARLLGGTCLVESRPGEGTRVVFRVPCPEEQVA